VPACQKSIRAGASRIVVRLSGIAASRSEAAAASNSRSTAPGSTA
jgi:hypothetical protein